MTATMKSELQPFVKSLICDRCEKEYADTLDRQEFLRWKDTCGYGNKTYGDGAQIAIDLCQHCVKDVLGPWMQIKKGW